MDWLFGKKKTPAELLRENKRKIDRAIRELDRERMALQAQEKKMVVDIKKMAKDGQLDAVKVMAKSVVRNRNAVTKLYQLKSQLQAVSLRMAELKSTQAMTEAMRGTTRAMAAMNRQMNLPALARIMRDFEKENARMEQTSEMMGSAVDMAFEGEAEEEETDQLVNEVLDSILADTNISMAKVPETQLQQAQAAPVAQQPALVGADGAAGGGLDEDLLARLDRLKNG
jgi:charged multivesicular body protein 2A